MISPPAPESEPRSPFPGMDPWVEDTWGDMHTSLTAYARDALQPTLPDGLRARVEEYMSIEAKGEEDLEENLRRPDVAIVETKPPNTPDLRADPAYTAVAVATEDEPVRLARFVEPPTLREIQILDTQHGNRLITSIEFLSPANKQGNGRKSFRDKQRPMMQADVNVVEIDLLRGGDWSVSVPIRSVPKKRRWPYRAAVVRATNPEDCEYYTIKLNARLPKIRIPLRPTDADVVLELQPLFEQAYRNGAYHKDIDYSNSPNVPLTPDESAIAQAFIQAAASAQRNGGDEAPGGEAT